MGCFNEMISCGVKDLALGVPVYDKQRRDIHLDYAKEICENAKTQYYIEDEAFITDLFPLSMNKRKYNLVFYKDEIYLQKYLMLKAKKDELVISNNYDQKNRTEIAYEFGKLLSYKDDDIFRMIKENDEKEIVNKKDLDINVKGQITFLYFDDLKKAVEFFKEIFGFSIYKDQGEDYCIILQSSASSYLGLVDRKRGSVKATTRDGVLVSFVVEDCEQVYEMLKTKNLGYLSKFSVNHKIGIKGFMFTGPEGYRFEIEEFI